MLIKGFGFSGYRSVGDDLAKINPLKRINLIIGQNNSGKSNIITFLKEHYSSLIQRARGTHQGEHTSTDLDLHLPNLTTMARIAIPLFPEGEELEQYLTASVLTEEPYRSYVTTLLQSEVLRDEEGYVWFIYESPRLVGVYSLKYDVTELETALNARDWKTLWNRVCNKQGGDLRAHWIPQTITTLALFAIPDLAPPIELIPAIRKIGEEGTEAVGFSGEGIIERLATLQHPSLEKLGLKAKFNDINHFIQTVLENDTASLEIPKDNSMIIVHMDGKSLPLSSLGTGIHEVVILAAAATVLENSVLCIEEPELHIHPILQRKLIQYLSVSTSNQYIFTTHSAHLLNTNDIEIFHVTYENQTTKVNAITTTKDKSNICHDLGYKASDILQANCLIWVEGPSDRIYISHWLKSIDDFLTEGIHYSIMFLGGRLFSHITAEDQDDLNEKVEDFISVRKLNRRTCIIFDSDKETARKHINKTKKRLKEEFDEGPGFCWVTKGREIENYIDSQDIEACVRAVHPSAKGIISRGQFSNLLIYRKRRSTKVITANKVKVARHYVENYEADLSVLDLEKKIDEIRNFIYESNGLTSSEAQH